MRCPPQIRRFLRTSYWGRSFSFCEMDEVSSRIKLSGFRNAPLQPWSRGLKSLPESWWVYTACIRRYRARLTRKSGSPLPELTTEIDRLSLVIEIGDMAVRVNTTDPGFVNILQNRYVGFLGSTEGHTE